MQLPWDFVVIGVPASSQGSSRRRASWKATVAAAARAAWPMEEPPLACDLQIQITFFHEDAPLDVDNMLKPIQDALIGIVYDDDKQITDTHGGRRNLNSAFRVRGVSPALASGFVGGEPFVHVRLSLPPNSEELP